MCDFLSAIATRDGRLLFCEDDSHETIERRAGLRDGDRHLRHWVRVEQRPGDAALRVDEASTPGWWDAEEWQPRLDALLARVRPVRAAYDEARRPVHAAYDEATRPARAAHAEATRTARAVYVAALAPIEGYCPALEVGRV